MYAIIGKQIYANDGKPKSYKEFFFYQASTLS